MRDMDTQENNNQQKAKSNRTCNYCGKYGHKETNCRNKKRDEESANVACEEYEVVFNCVEETGMKCVECDRENSNIFVAANTWIAESGATCHMTNSDVDMTGVKIIDEFVKIGNGKEMRATKIGYVTRMVKQRDGISKKVTLEVKYVPDLWINLFSLTKPLENGSKLGNDGIHITISKGNTTIKFDKILKTKTGFVGAVEIAPLPLKDQANMTLDKVKLTTLHDMLGHAGEYASRLTANYYSWKTTGKLSRCESCGLSKARQSPIPNKVIARSKIPGERLFIDISSVKSKSLGGLKFWLLIIDDATDFCWSFFLKKKGDLSKIVRELINDLKAKIQKTVKYIRCDNAGENKSLEKDAKRDGLGIQFEWTAQGTPQQNGRVERKFKTLYGRVRAMFKEAGLTEEIKNGIWSEGASTATLLENIICTPLKRVPAHEQLFISRVQFIRRTKEAATQAACAGNSRG